MDRLNQLLDEISQTITDRGRERDQDDGERSMKQATDAWWTIFGPNILQRGYPLESELWYFMVMLKFVRSTGGGFNRDDNFDAAAYAVLGLESVEKENRY